MARLNPTARHGRAFGSYGFYKSIGYTLGPLLGGVLVWFGGLRLLFVVMAVGSLAVAAWSAIAVPTVPPLTRTRQTVVDLARRLSDPGFVRPTAALAGATAALSVGVGFLPVTGAAAGLGAVATGAAVSVLAATGALVQPKAVVPWTRVGSGRVEDSLRGSCLQRVDSRAPRSVVCGGVLAAAVLIGAGTGLITPLGFAALAATTSPAATRTDHGHRRARPGARRRRRSPPGRRRCHRRDAGRRVRRAGGGPGRRSRRGARHGVGTTASRQVATNRCERRRSGMLEQVFVIMALAVLALALTTVAVMAVITVRGVRRPHEPPARRAAVSAPRWCPLVASAHGGRHHRDRCRRASAASPPTRAPRSARPAGGSFSATAATSGGRWRRPGTRSGWRSARTCAVGDLPLLTAQLDTAARGVDSVYRASSRVRSLRPEARLEARRIEGAAQEIHRAALDSLRANVTADTEPILSAVRIEVAALAAGVRASHRASRLPTG